MATKLTGTRQKITTVGAGSTPSTNAVKAKAVRIAVGPAAGCFVEMSSASPTAALASSLYMPAGWVETFAIRPGNKVAIIREATTDTFVTVDEIN